MSRNKKPWIIIKNKLNAATKFSLGFGKSITIILRISPVVIYPRPSVWGSQFVFSSCNLSMFICDWTYNRFCLVCQLKVFRTGFPVSINWLISNPWFVKEMSEIRDCNFEHNTSLGAVQLRKFEIRYWKYKDLGGSIKIHFETKLSSWKVGLVDMGNKMLDSGFNKLVESRKLFNSG